MTTQRLVEDYARWLWNRDRDRLYAPTALPEERTPDNYLNEAAIFLGGELGQRLQREFYERGYRDGRNDTKLRDEITDRANVEADLRAQPAEAKARLQLLRDAMDESYQDSLERRS